MRRGRLTILDADVAVAFDFPETKLPRSRPMTSNTGEPKIQSSACLENSLRVAILLAAGTMLSACGVNGTIYNRLSKPSEVCAPTTLTVTPNSVVPLCAKWRSLGNWAVKRPDGTWLYVVGHMATTTSRQFPAYRTGHGIYFRPAVLQGQRSGSTDSVSEPVFTAEGRYRLYFAENVETESDSTTSLWVDIQYRRQPNQ
jgi:hypothetical protein